MRKTITLFYFLIIPCLIQCQETKLIRNDEHVYNKSDFLPELTQGSDTIYTEFTDFVLVIKFNYKLPCSDIITENDTPASLYNVDILDKKSISFNSTDSIPDTILFNTHYLLVPDSICFQKNDIANILIAQGLSSLYINMVKIIDRKYLYMKQNKNYAGYSWNTNNYNNIPIKTNIEKCIKRDMNDN